MSPRTALELANDWIAAYNGRDLEHLMADTRPDARISLAGGLITYDDAAAWRNHNTTEWSTFPDAEFEVTQSLEGEQCCSIEGYWHATMEGDGAMPDGTVPASRSRCTTICAVRAPSWSTAHRASAKG